MKKYSILFYLLVLILMMTMSNLVIGQEEKEKVITIGLVVRDLTASYQIATVKAAQKKAEELGIELIVQQAFDASRYLDTIDNFITMEVDGVIFGAIPDPSAVLPGTKKLTEVFGIPLIDTDTAALGGKIDYYIGFDIKDSSARATEVMMQELKSRNNGQVPSGVVIEVMGDLQEGFASECSKGFHSVIDQYKELTVVQGDGQWNNDDVFRIVSNFITRFGDKVVAVYVHTLDCMAVGSINAIKAAGIDPKNIVSAGICIGPEAIELLKKGEFTVAIEQPMDISGEMAVELLYKIITKQAGLPKIGDTIIKEGALWSPAEVVESPYADGAYIKLKGPLVPQEVLPDDPRLWENRTF